METVSELRKRRDDLLKQAQALETEAKQAEEQFKTQFPLHVRLAKLTQNDIDAGYAGEGWYGRPPSYSAEAANIYFTLVVTDRVDLWTNAVNYVLSQYTLHTAERKFAEDFLSRARIRGGSL